MEEGRGWRAKRKKERCGRIERESRMEALRKETKNRRNKEKQRRRMRKGGSESRFPLAIETTTEPERERRKEGRRGGDSGSAQDGATR